MDKVDNTESGSRVGWVPGRLNQETIFTRNQQRTAPASIKVSPIALALAGTVAVHVQTAEGPATTQPASSTVEDFGKASPVYRCVG